MLADVVGWVQRLPGPDSSERLAENLLLEQEGGGDLAARREGAVVC